MRWLKMSQIGSFSLPLSCKSSESTFWQQLYFNLESNHVHRIFF